jgi:hypothetical protein
VIGKEEKREWSEGVTDGVNSGIDKVGVFGVFDSLSTHSYQLEVNNY